MATAEEEKQAQIKKLAAQQDDANLQHMLQAETRAKQQQMKEELNSMGREKRSAKGKDYWEQVGKNADALLKKGNEGYQDWVAGMNSIVNTMMDLAMALSLDPIGNSDYAAIGLLKFGFEAVNDVVLKPIASLAPYEVGQFVEGVGTMASDYIGNTRVGSTLGLGAKVPDVKFSVNVDGEGHLVSGATKDGIPFGEAEQMRFDAGLVAWASKHDYSNKPDPNNPGKVRLEHTDGTVMTPDKFKSLSQDPQTGLQSFMEGRFNINMQHEPPRESTGPTI